MTHEEMRAVLREAFRRRFGREASTSEVQHLQAVAFLETNYGKGWKPPGHDSNNLGAIQAGAGWTGPTFSYTDTRPNGDGTSTPYVTKFRKYATLAEGADDLVRTVYQSRERDTKVLPFATRGDSLGFSRALHETGYYEGFGSTIEERVRNHHRAVAASIRAQAHALHESLPSGLTAAPVPNATLKRGAKGPAVELLQEALNAHGAFPGVKVDGDFGKKTHDAVRVFQQRNRLIADGIVGQRTWAKLLASPDPAPAA